MWTLGEQGLAKDLWQDLQKIKEGNPTRTLVIEYYVQGATEKWLERDLKEAWVKASAGAIKKSLKSLRETPKNAWDMAYAIHLSSEVLDHLKRQFTSKIFPSIDAAIATTYMGAKQATYKRVKGVYKSLALERKHVDPGPTMVRVAKKKAKRLSDYVSLRYPNFTLEDWRAINVMRKHQMIFALRYVDTYRTDIIEFVRDVILTPGIETRQAGRLLREKFGHLFQNGPAMARIKPDRYFEGLAQHIVSTARVTGLIEGFREYGVATYRWVSMLDKAVCETCAFLEDKVWETRQALDVISQVENAVTPEQAINAHPWMSLEEIKARTGITTPGFAGSTSAALEEARRLSDVNITHPPIHFRCRCTLDIDTRLTWRTTTFPAEPPPRKPMEIVVQWTPAKVLEVLQTEGWERLFGEGGLSREEFRKLPIETKRQIYTAMGEDYKKALENAKTTIDRQEVFKRFVEKTGTSLFESWEEFVKELKWRKGENIIDSDFASFGEALRKIWTKRAVENMDEIKPVQWSIGRTGRSYFRPPDIIELSRRSESIAVHEYGHYMEESSKLVQEQVREFMEERTKGETAVPLKKYNPFLRDDEYTKPDKWWDPYVGKIYTDGATEFISMGTEAMYEMESFGAVSSLQNDPESIGLLLMIRLGLL